MPVRHAWFTPLLSTALRGTLDRYALSRERARLREMSDAQLSDLGITRPSALAEARRPFWDGTRCR